MYYFIDFRKSELLLKNRAKYCKKFFYTTLLYMEVEKNEKDVNFIFNFIVIYSCL